MAEPWPRPPNRGVVISPLHQDRPAEELTVNILRLLNCVGIRCMDIAKISVNRGAGYAKVRLNDKECEEFTLKAFKEIASIMNIYDLRYITRDPHQLRVVRSAPVYLPGEQLISNLSISNEGPQLRELDASSLAENHRTSQELIHGPLPSSSPRQEVLENETPLIGAQDEVRGHEEEQHDTSVAYTMLLEQSSSSATNTIESPLISQHTCGKIEEKDDDNHTLTYWKVGDMGTDPTVNLASNPRSSGSLSTLPYYAGQLDQEVPPSESTSSLDSHILVDAKTSTALVSPGFCSGTIFYHQRQRLSQEIDCACTLYHPGDALANPRVFRELVGTFVCAVVNSGDGGVLAVGVGKDGEVEGVAMSQRQEDTIRLDIDHMVKLIQPSVPTSAYTVNFAQVMNSRGQIVADLKVLELRVKAGPRPGQKSQFKNVSYVIDSGKVQHALSH